jgi:hypothetical protein
MGKQVSSSIKRLLSKSMSKSMKKQLMKIAKKHEKGVTRKKKKKKKKTRTFMKHNVSREGREGREGIDFKTFHIDLTKPSSCIPKRKCKSHRMSIPKRRNGCKSNGHKSNGHKSNKGKIMMNYMKRPNKKCNESFVHFLNL